MEKKDEKEYIFIKERVKEEPSAMVKVIARVLKLICIGAVLALMICFGIVFLGNGFNMLSWEIQEQNVDKEPEDNNEDEGSEKNDKKKLSPKQQMRASLVVVKVEKYKSEEENGEKEGHKETEEIVTLAISDDKEVKETTKASEEEITKKERETTTAAKDIQNIQMVKEHIQLGVIVKNDRNVYIALPYDKIENGEYLTVTFCDGKKSEATVIGKNEEKNLAVAMVKEEDIKPSTRESIRECKVAKLSEKSKGLEIWYASIDGKSNENEIYMVKGNVSAIEDNLVTYDFCYTGVVTNIRKKTENTGFIFDKKGSVVVMTESIYSKDEYEAYVTGVYMQDIMNTILKLVKGNLSNYAGIAGEAVTDSMRKLTGEDMPDGVYVTDVDKEASAYKAGLMVGDIIVTVNGKQAKSLKDVQTTLENISANMTLAIDIKRKIGKGYNDLTLKIPVESY